MSSDWIRGIERKASAAQARGERRAKLKEDMRAADDPLKTWPALDIADVLGMPTVIKKRLLDHFASAGKDQISLLEIMEMCSYGEDEHHQKLYPQLYRVYGIWKIGYWAVVNGLTKMNLIGACGEEWKTRLAVIKEANGIGLTPYWNEEN